MYCYCARCNARREREFLAIMENPANGYAWFSECLLTEAERQTFLRLASATTE